MNINIILNLGIFIISTEADEESDKYYFIPSILPEEKPVMFSYMRKVFSEFERERDRQLIRSEEEREKELTLEVSLNSHIKRWNKPPDTAAAADHTVEECEGGGDSSVDKNGIDVAHLSSAEVEVVDNGLVPNPPAELSNKNSKSCFL
jgi:hypothetical protein